MKKVLIYIMLLVLVTTSLNYLAYAEEQPTPTAVMEYQKICGYLKASSGGNAGFVVTVSGWVSTSLRNVVYTNDEGYFEVGGKIAKSDDFKLKVSITKDSYLSRNISISSTDNVITLGSADAPFEMWAGDLNKDNSINMIDIVSMARYFNTSKGDNKYNKSVDINGDGAINMLDVVIAARNFNKTSDDYTSPKITFGKFQPGSTPASSVMVPYADYNITTGKNIVFCPTFQIVWDLLKNQVGEDVKLTRESPMVDFLNKGYEWSNSISENSYVAKGGKGSIVDEINETLKTKFGKDAPTVQNVDQDKYVFYAYLLKQLKFATAFVDTNPISFQDSKGQFKQVKSFGIKYDSGFTKYRDLANQVQVFDYKNGNDFIVKLLPEDENEEIILAKVEPDATLYDTYKTVMERMSNSNPYYFGLTDTIEIPEVALDMEKNYDELENNTILNGELKSCEIEKAYQNVKFNLDKEGAKLASEAIMVVPTPGIGPHIDTSMHLTFNKQYMICLKQKNAQNPYLLIWVDNPDILVEN